MKFTEEELDGPNENFLGLLSTSWGKIWFRLPWLQANLLHFGWSFLSLVMMILSHFDGWFDLDYSSAGARKEFQRCIWVVSYSTIATFLAPLYIKWVWLLKTTLPLPLKWAFIGLSSDVKKMSSSLWSSPSQANFSLADLVLLKVSHMALLIWLIHFSYAH